MNHFGLIYYRGVHISCGSVQQANPFNNNTPCVKAHCKSSVGGAWVFKVIAHFFPLQECSWGGWYCPMISCPSAKYLNFMLCSNCMWKKERRFDWSRSQWGHGGYQYGDGRWGYHDKGGTRSNINGWCTRQVRYPQSKSYPTLRMDMTLLHI